MSDQSAEARLRASLRELLNAFYEYEMNVDQIPPLKHQDMIERARATLATAPAKPHPQIHNLKMLDDIHRVIVKHSNNKELADEVWNHLIAGGPKDVTAPPTSYNHLA